MNKTKLAKIHQEMSNIAENLKENNSVKKIILNYKNNTLIVLFELNDKNKDQ
ncbi:hypothetical protein [Avibacterium paragallinarum]|uniref:hypothetical protein n=1 Tax=Avibacterium paragallinarum TaxID=728 RepID=UPI003978A9DD